MLWCNTVMTKDMFVLWGHYPWSSVIKWCPGFSHWNYCHYPLTDRDYSVLTSNLEGIQYYPLTSP